MNNDAHQGLVCIIFVFRQKSWKAKRGSKPLIAGTTETAVLVIGKKKVIKNKIKTVRLPSTKKAALFLKFDSY